ncbi:MAG: hypothetical protein MUE73_16200, partial [Planctomycetes bacterium]|nr:hypothetical protein [Planctomycetota bacterium]
MDFRWDSRWTATPARSAGALGLDATSPHATGGRAGVRPDPGADGAANAGHARRQNRLSRIEGAFSTLATSRARFLEALPPKDIGGRPSERLRRLRGAWFEHRGYLEILLSLVGDYLLEEHDPSDRKATLRLEELL